MRAVIFSLAAAVIVVATSYAQTPAPVVVPAMTPATSQSPAAAAVTTSAQTTLKALQAMKAANDEILKEQAATLQKLEELEKAANDIRIYTKRG